MAPTPQEKSQLKKDFVGIINECKFKLILFVLNAGG
jgi:hypothetical protein